MASGDTNKTLQEWRDKIQSALDGNYESLQAIKEYIFELTDPLHPIFKQSFYDILHQGYHLHELAEGDLHSKTYQTYREIGMIFLLQGALEIKCINLEADTQSLKIVRDKGLLEVTKEQLAAKYGETNVKLITKFEMQAAEPTIFIEILGSNKMVENQIARNEPISDQEHNVMRKFLIFPSREVQRVKINSDNKYSIDKKFYLLNGKVCFYLHQEGGLKQALEPTLILTAYHEGYFNPSQFQSKQVEEETSSTSDKKKIPDRFGSKSPSKLKTIKNGTKGPEADPQKIKMYIFQGSEIMYFEEDFMKDDYLKAIQSKRKEHLLSIQAAYSSMSKDEICSLQDKLIVKYRLPRKEVNCCIFKLPSIQRETGKKGMSATAVHGKDRISTDKTIKSKADLRSTSSSVKCSMRIRKVKKN